MVGILLCVRYVFEADAKLVPAVTHLNNYAPVFALNDTFMTSINQRAEQCGYFDFMEQALTFPPSGKFVPPNSSAPGCDVWDDIVSAEIYVNPCFNIYHLTDVSFRLHTFFISSLFFIPTLFSTGPAKYLSCMIKWTSPKDMDTDTRFPVLPVFVG